MIPASHFEIAPPKFSLGSTPTARQLKEEFGSHFVLVLTPRYIERIPTLKKRAHTRYKIISNLPTSVKYSAMLDKACTVNVDKLISEAYGEIDCLADELRNWFDNLGESLQTTGTGEMLKAAADTLENVQDKTGECKDAKSVEIIFYPATDLSSRPKRLSNAIDQLRQAADALNQSSDDSEVIDFVNELTNDADEVDQVEFPRMYGG